ncbi:A-kinase anchor protein 17A-like [Haliotis rufescens]|uniref:A-kinase anchor protein 17A-like n=1 Tax=Haliotis rufescens TaxID=6454 RepID=UPI001EAFB715|nr:A-kinase anchor protein 17A-like [Haliotis rufescens]
MSNTTVCNDTSEAVELHEPMKIYLKPIAKLNVCVQLPQLKTPGKSISNWEVMEKVKHMIRPEIFITLKIVKSSLEFIRLEGEIENKGKIKLLIAKLDGKAIKLSGFPDSLKVRAAEAKISFPLRHDWDSYFRDAKNMNEMKSGERPDTIHFKDLPTRWFASRKDSKKDKPCEQVLRRVFEVFGEVRCVDIPMLDPYRKEIIAATKPGSIQTFCYGQDLTFDAYVQFKEYISFVKAMDALRGMKLMNKDEEGKALTANIKVDFDKTKHLSDKAIRKRRLEREKLEELEKIRLMKSKQEKEENERKEEEERQKKIHDERERERRKQEKLEIREERRKEREEQRRDRHLKRRRCEEEERMKLKIAMEERKLLLAKRKLESLHLLTELFNRIKEDKFKEDLERKEKELECERVKQVEMERKRKLEEEMRKAEVKKRKQEELMCQEKELREKILRNIKAKEEKKLELERELLRKKLSGKHKLKSAVVLKK